MEERKEDRRKMEQKHMAHSLKEPQQIQNSMTKGLGTSKTLKYQLGINIAAATAAMDSKGTNSGEDVGVPLLPVGQVGTTQISGIGLLSEDTEVGLSLQAKGSMLLSQGDQKFRSASLSVWHGAFRTVKKNYIV